MFTHSKTTAVGLCPADVHAASATTADFDISAYFGQGKVILDAEAQGSGITNTIKIQSSDLAVGGSYTTDGDTDRKLNLSTSGKTKLAVKFTQSGARSIKHVDLMLKAVGTIAGSKTLTVTIEGDSSGPDGSVAGTAGTVDPTTVATNGYQWVRFTFATPVELADSTVYWVILTTNLDASDTNYIEWHTVTVVSGGTLSAYAPSSWSAVTTEKPLFRVYQYNFTDVTGGAFSAVGNTASLQSLGLMLDSLGSGIRVVSTVAGGSSTGAYSVVLVAPTQNV